MTLEVIWLHIWNQQPWLPWYPCAYCLQWPPRPWRPQNDLGGLLTSDLKSATLITRPVINVHIASNGLRGHGNLKTTSEVIRPQIWNQQPWLPWYPCAYCLQRPLRSWRPLRPWRPPNDLGGHMTSDLTSATSITLVSMPILLPTAILVASGAMATSNWPRRSHLTSKLNSVTSITYVAMLLLPLTASSDPIFRRWWKPNMTHWPAWLRRR